ncbi:MAG: penicillin acylase family protein [Pseudomonadota bacterium]|nr:penicillin acylase family protein [Pseudomonadota bacterium]
MRWLGRILITLLLLIALALAVCWLLLAGSRPQLDGTIALLGLSAPVQITRDANGVPTIDARNHHDLVYALGFLHGQERFFQMDLLRRNAAGELSELVGKAALKADENHRRHRFRVLARRELAMLTPHQRDLLDAYRDGVNAGLHSLDMRPWEYLLLGVKPQKWRTEDSILAIDAMFLDLNQDGENVRELNIARLRAVLPKALADFLLAPDPRWQAPLQDAIDTPVPMPNAGVFDLRTHPLIRVSLAQGALAIAATAREDTGIGSNGFAVGGALTGGAALLANDPHLTLRVPDIWYRARLRYPDPADPKQTIDLNGVTLPGVPALVIGSNGHIAWGFTNTEGDWMDWVRVLRAPSDPSRYPTSNGWATIERHDEVIRVHGAPDEHFIVEDTIWGPIMATDSDGTPLALAWIAHEPRALNLNLLKMETAHSVNDALALAPTIGIPPQNMMVADAQGLIGWSVAGSAIPLRAGFDPSQLADWSKVGIGWIGFAAPAQDPRIENPPNARLWTANQRLVDGAALKLLSDGGYDLGARAQQIRDDLTSRNHFAPRDMLNIQLDDRALFLARWQKLLLDTLANTRDPKLLALKPYVEHWQARAVIDSVGYRIVRAFHDRVRGNALAPFAALAKSKSSEFKWPNAEIDEYAVWAMVTQKPAWLVDPKYKDWNALLLDSAREVADDLAELLGPLSSRTWGERNTARIDHPLSVALPHFLARFIDMPPDELPGDRDMPRVQHPDFSASMRMDVMPGDEAHGILEMPSGQADNPLTPYFGAGHEDWMRGAPTPLLPGAAKYKITLKPVAAR